MQWAAPLVSPPAVPVRASAWLMTSGKGWCPCVRADKLRTVNPADELLRKLKQAKQLAKRYRDLTGRPLGIPAI